MREASAFWAKMSVKKELEGRGEVLDWLSTHPADDRRRESIDRSIPQLERVRSSCQVSPPGLTVRESYRGIGRYLVNEYLVTI